METIDSKYNIKGFAESRIGGRPDNQDSYGYSDTPSGFLGVVCDGMGGASGGKTASTIAVKEIIDSVSNADKQNNPSMILIKAIRSANMKIIQEGENHPELAGMGTTATVILINEKSATIAHVGDSRIYQLRGQNPKKVYRTSDHSVVFEMVKKKVITEEQARLSSESNIITRALGMKSDLEVDTKELFYDKDDRFLLCSDGIHGTMPEKELLQSLNKNKNMSGALESLANKVDTIGRNGNGHYDNLTAMFIEVNKNSINRNKMEKKLKIALMTVMILLLLSLCVNAIMFKKDKTMEFKVGENITIENKANEKEDYKITETDGKLSLEIQQESETNINNNK